LRGALGGRPLGQAQCHHTRDFEDLVAWLAQQIAKTPITRPLRIGWGTVGTIIERVVADRIDHHRLDRLVQVGVDEISYRRGQRYLTTVVDHDSGGIVWCAPGRNAQTLQAFFDLLGERKDSIQAVSIARWSLLKSPEKQTLDQLAKLDEVQQANKPLYRAFLLKEELRLLYHLDDPVLAPEHLDARLTWASRSRLEPFVKLARTIRRHQAGILAAIRLGLDNGRLEGLNSRIRLISHRSFGFHSPAPLIALIHLCCAGVQIPLPR
jgi:transposase